MAAALNTLAALLAATAQIADQRNLEAAGVLLGESRNQVHTALNALNALDALTGDRP